MNNQTDSTGAIPTNPQEVARVAIKIPPFWEEDPETWFAQIEMQFALNGITQDTTKFYYVASNLEHRHAKEVRDIIRNPPATEKYSKLKTELITRLSASEDHKIKQLLEREEIGDRTPSQFLRHIRDLAGNIPDAILKSLWLGRLPRNTQAILASMDSKSLEEMGRVADKIHETNASNVHIESADTPEIIANRTHQSQFDMLRTEVNQLRTEIRNRRSSPSRSRRRSTSESRSHANPDWCYFHKKFGSNARKCRDPCSFNRSENYFGGQ